MSNSLKRQAAYGRGKHAEHLAAEHLRAQGYVIMHERFKTEYGEIDLIAQREKWILFVEVKARQSHEAALESITPRQVKRIIAAANHFLTTIPADSHDLRFDVITFCKDGVLRHLENALQSDC